MASSIQDLPEKQWNRAYFREIGVVVAAAAVVNVPVGLALDNLHGAVRYAVALIPVVPFLGIPLVVVRMRRRIDEYQREALQRGIFFAFFASAVITYCYGWLEQAGAPRLSAVWVWPVMGATWLGTSAYEVRRAR